MSGSEFYFYSRRFHLVCADSDFDFYFYFLFLTFDFESPGYDLRVDWALKAMYLSIPPACSTFLLVALI